MMGTCPHLCACSGQLWGPNPMGAKRMVTGRDGHFAALVCFQPRLLSSAHSQTDLPESQWGNQGTEAWMVGFEPYEDGIASAQTLAFSSGVVLPPWPLPLTHRLWIFCSCDD